MANYFKYMLHSETELYLQLLIFILTLCNGNGIVEYNLMSEPQYLEIIMVMTMIGSSLNLQPSVRIVPLAHNVLIIHVIKIKIYF